MNRAKYIYHVRDRLIDTFRKEIDSMTDDEILEFNRVCIFCMRELINKTIQDHAIIEGSSLDEVDRMLDGNREHNCPILRSDPRRDSDLPAP